MFGSMKKQDTTYWIVLAIIILIFYFVFSNGQFSLLFTLAGTVQTYGFLLIVLKTNKSRSVVGLSLQTFINYTLIFGIRSLIFLFYQGYLPQDTTGDFIFILQQFIAFGLSGYIIYLICSQFKTSYDRDLDTVKSYYLIILAAVLAVLFHSDFNKSFLADYLWAFSQYLQTFAIFSQLYLFKNKKGDIQSYTSHFVAAQASSRILYITFWIFTYAQLNTDRAMSMFSEYAGYWFMTSQFIHLSIMGDFMYYYIKSIRSGPGAIYLPTYI